MPGTACSLFTCVIEYHDNRFCDEISNDRNLSTPNCAPTSATVDVCGPIAIANLTTLGPGANETISIICTDC